MTDGHVQPLRPPIPRNQAALFVRFDTVLSLESSADDPPSRSLFLHVLLSSITSYIYDTPPKYEINSAEMLRSFTRSPFVPDFATCIFYIYVYNFICLLKVFIKVLCVFLI